MRFKDVFSIIGPPMIGPSSSHTAGAARIGRAARQLFGPLPKRADVIFYGSFAATYEGHGTYAAIVGGLLDMATDDVRLPDSLAIAEQSGMQADAITGKGLFPHPNTAELHLYADAGDEKPAFTLVGTSIGGGNIEIVDIDGFKVKMTGNYPTLVIQNADAPGMIAIVARLLQQHGINIGTMSVDRKSRSGEAMMVLETDEDFPPTLRGELAAYDEIHSVRFVHIT
ncbi:L-serine ammonia-lyase, iron-sulfur-dependent subunit beta [Paenibacillus sacheonensis]|uniref:L-serine deaminase n=1 Tax=Paenibacillus sacheonensis TaxID=742054 RepID=A0A7X5C1C4_9BACL|nr:L-serine dehydratase [Paenibacillus sacheonensis]NBC72556.1 L-serine ammonia-lyase, iron-sulfur-dependent, subunit beta [Paenibacillus sacheonensis]